MKTRMVDCVGYLVDEALGHTENGEPRMVRTPWEQDTMPFVKAAEIGTHKVIEDHSTIGIVITTDGSITDISRESYIPAEERVIHELKEIHKPFVVLLNSTHPEELETVNLKRNLEEKYNVPVIPADISNLTENNISQIFERVLEEFPVTEIAFKLPNWFNLLDDDSELKRNIVSVIRDNFTKDFSIREITVIAEGIRNSSDIFTNVSVDNAKLDNGNVKISLEIAPNLFFNVLSEKTNMDIHDECDIFKTMKDYAAIKKEYDKIKIALDEVRVKGYGIVTPQIDELSLEEPEIVKQGSKFGVKLKASAPSIHMIRADIETEVSPIVGSEKQSEDLVKYLLSEFETDPIKIWQSNIFGKSLHELVNEGLNNKLAKMPDEAQMKLQETLTRIINEGSGGLICIIL